ncbi:B-cell antigen receptor complex-associated protein beta chain [Parambassis ranga]|uniref:B-cell antigen receptor complex-associated protein beta chain n=1 Tax=Parambassis ranga TaxID=210632 RepID=A0A6P7IGP6_9TELE|nr:B-cell antigen receptor complex-associated protein beta chain [Parambassis ranga]
MRWTLAGCCWLAVLSLSGALSGALKVTQKPRFLGVRTDYPALFYCLPSLHGPGRVQWFRADEYDSPVHSRTEVQAGDGTGFQNHSLIQNAILFLHKLRTQDSGVYFCKINQMWGPGSELQVAKPIDFEQALYRTKMKDGLIILQALLLAVCVAAVLTRRHTLLEKNDSVYEEPETDHIYEGLAIESCGGGLYEELAVYSQPEEAEAPWE